MPRPARPALLALATLSASLAACGASGRGDCPGDTIGVFDLAGTRNLASDPADPTIPACPPETGFDDAPIAFSGTLSSDAGTSGAAFCSGRDHAETLFGSRSGDAVHLEATTSGAILGGCGACAAELTIILDGTVQRDSAGAATGFGGSYIERMRRIEGDCGTCPLPCDARYDVTGAPAP
jgi:hypothetical protein